MKESNLYPAATSSAIQKKKLLSLITPAYNEADNLSLLYERLSHVLDPAGIDWEWIVVDDSSVDKTYEVIKDLAKRDPRVRGIRFARNFGSHKAMICGLHYSKGACAVVLAADLQDPPETLPDLLAKWHEGMQVVWAVRQRREGEKITKVGFSRLYYFIMRHMVGIKEMPVAGSDFFLIDRKVIETLLKFHESNVSVLVLLTWMGFRT